VVTETSLTADDVGDLYERYGYFLLRRCRMILKDDSLAHDAVQETFLKVMRGGTESSAVQRPLRWLYRIADNCCFDHIRKRRHTAETTEPPDPVGPHPGIQIEMRDAILAVLGELDDEAKRIAMLAFVDGLSQSEIADELGWSRVTINKKIQAIRTRADRILTQPPRRLRGAP
jgi:RNA polymerase sigma factor (sigma-70 family)